MIARRTMPSALFSSTHFSLPGGSKYPVQQKFQYVVKQRLPMRIFFSIVILLLQDEAALCWWILHQTHHSINPLIPLSSSIQANVFLYGSISLIVDPCRIGLYGGHGRGLEGWCVAVLRPQPLTANLAISCIHAKEQIISIWDKVDVIKVSDVGLEFLTRSNKIESASAMSLWHPNLKLLLVTLEEKGCKYYGKVHLLFTLIVNYGIIGSAFFIGTASWFGFNSN